jgi:hypothetical protein
VAEDKSARVLQDVISAMFSDTFINELFKPQPVRLVVVLVVAAACYWFIFYAIMSSHLFNINVK